MLFTLFRCSADESLVLRSPLRVFTDGSADFGQGFIANVSCLEAVLDAEKMLDGPVAILCQANEPGESAFIKIGLTKLV